jgi:hypothetical protein
MNPVYYLLPLLVFCSKPVLNGMNGHSTSNIPIESFSSAHTDIMYGCPVDEYHINNETVNSGVYQRHAGIGVFVANSTFIGSVNVSLKAGYSVEMNPGFVAEPGNGSTAEFRAEIEACPPVNPGSVSELEMVVSSPCAVGVFPNPVGEQLKVSLPTVMAQNPVTVLLTDSYGRIIFRRSEISERQLNINLSGVLPGMYYITVSDATCKRVIKITKAQ